MTASEIHHALSLRDLTSRAEGPHAMQCLVEDVEIALRNLWRCRALRQDGERTVPTPEGRAPRPDLRAVVAEGIALLGCTPGDVLLSCAGIVFSPGLRAGEPGAALEASHHLAVWRLRTGRRLTTETVESMVHTVTTTLLPDRTVHLREVPDGETTEALCLEVENEEKALEIGTCGLVHPATLAALGVDPGRTSAVALALRLDRILMLRKGIDDVGLLRSEEPRVVRQMRELDRYRPAATI